MTPCSFADGTIVTEYSAVSSCKIGDVTVYSTFYFFSFGVRYRLFYPHIKEQLSKVVVVYAVTYPLRLAVLCVSKHVQMPRNFIVSQGPVYRCVLYGARRAGTA